MLRTLSRLGCIFVAACLAGCRGGSARGHNVLFVTLDTVRADRIGAYGYAAAETPALDRLAREGTRFETAVAAVPLTLPSHATLLSGLLPLHHGLRNNGTGRLPDGIETLATRLSASGYRTAAFIGAFVLDRRFGLGRGFELYDDEIERDPGKQAGLVAERPGAEVVGRALAWLEKGGEKPFFLWVHLYDAHAPYEPPEPFRSRYTDRPYDGEIASLDAQIARLFAALDTARVSDRTLVVVVGDHGEALGDHGELTHGLLVYEPTLRVPLLLRAPGVLPAGKVVQTPVGLADVAPTVAGLLELPLAPAGTVLDGRDLSSTIRRGAEPAATDLYAESEYPRTFGWSGLAALRRGTLKYIAAPRPELYDLGADPQEKTNLAPSDARRAGLEARLAEIQRSSRATPVESANGDGTRERLAALGYVAAGPALADRGTLRDPKDVVGLFRSFEEASWALQGGRLEEATSKLEAVVAADPANAVFRGLLAQSWRRRGDLVRAITLYREAVAAAPDDSDARYNLAVTLQEAGRRGEALAAAQEAVRRDPARPEAHNALGIALFSEGKLQEPLAEFDRVVELDPRDAQAHNNRGNVLRQQERFDEAQRAYERAIELAPRYADPQNGLGVLEVQRDRPAQALPRFERALALAPELHEVRLNRALALEMMKDYPRAIEAYRDFVRAAGGDPAFARQRQVALQLIARLSNR
jgi:arylsulfatase A-like enzyme/Flp pilus assembly protein TadD